MQKLLILSLALICLINAKPQIDRLHEYTFEQYIQDFEKNYEKQSNEYSIRQQLFENNLKEAIQHNTKYALNQTSYTKSVNTFSDMTESEFKKHLGYNKGMKTAPQGKMFLAPQQAMSDDILATLPKSVDWRTKGVVSPVKTQQQCGSCWAFASVAVLESHAAITSGQLNSLSEQELVSCMPNPRQCGGTGGCEGAIAELAMEYVHQNGITTEALYPYSSGNGTTTKCVYDAEKMPPKVTVDGYVQLPKNSYVDLMHALANVGPVSISVDASNWHSYHGGIYDGCDYNKNVDLDHAVVAVGYGSDSTGDYWIVRNSWTSHYGEDGYIRVKRDTGAQRCGTDSTPADGVACKGETTPQKVCGMCGILSDSVYPTGVKTLA